MRTLFKHLNKLLPSLFLQISFTFFVVIGTMLATVKTIWLPFWLFPRLSAIAAFLYAFFLILPRLIWKIRDEDEIIIRRKHRTLLRLQVYIAIGLLLGFFGTLGFFSLYRIGFPYDKILHFLFPFLAIIAVSRFIYRWYNVSLNRALLVASIVVIVPVILWEFFEFGSDQLFQTGAWGQDGKNIKIDTTLDVIFGFLGIIFGAIAVKIRKNPWPY